MNFSVAFCASIVSFYPSHGATIIFITYCFHEIHTVIPIHAQATMTFNVRRTTQNSLYMSLLVEMTPHPWMYAFKHVDFHLLIRKTIVGYILLECGAKVNVAAVKRMPHVLTALENNSYTGNCSGRRTPRSTNYKSHRMRRTNAVFLPSTFHTWHTLLPLFACGR